MLSWLAHAFVICKTHAFAAKKALCDGEKKKNLQAEIWRDLIQA